MTLKITVITPDPRLFVREHNRTIREVNVMAAEYHHRFHMPRHFKMEGYQRYGIARRSAAYNKRKQRLRGHTLPLVFSGLTQQLVLSQRKITATPKRARLTMRAAFEGGTGRVRLRPGMTRKQLSSQMEAMRRVAELEAVSPDEIESLAKLRGQWYAERVQKYIAAGGRIRKRVK